MAALSPCRLVAMAWHGRSDEARRAGGLVGDPGIAQVDGSKIPTSLLIFSAVTSILITSHITLIFDIIQEHDISMTHICYNMMLCGLI
jgi:hypothetical protein